MAKFTVRIILLDDQGRTKRIIQGEKDFDGKCPEKGEVVEFKDFVSWLLPTILCVDLEKGTLSATTKFPRLITALMLNQPKIWTETAV